MKKKHKVLKIVLISVGGFFATILTIVGAFLIYASATTLKVEDECSVDINGNASKSLNSTDTVKIMSWNIGYASLDEEADFFMDGGKTTRGISKEKTEENLKALKEKMVENDPDILMVQEIDIDSHRSHRVNELNSFKETFREDTYTNDFAFNYKAGYVPYPIPTIGKVNSGISTFSKYQMQDAKRVQLPIPFSWPVSLVNLKRCLLINRIHLEDVDKDLVVINLHLEAYDDGEGKTKQFNMLKEVMTEEYEKGNYVVAGGDFNQQFSSVDSSMYPYYEGNWSVPIVDVSDFNHFSCVMDNSHPTCRLLNEPYKTADKDKFQYYMIDGYIVSDNLSIESLETLDYEFKNTDHNPVLMSFKFN